MKVGIRLMKLLQRYCLFLCGIFFMSLGICMIIASSLGSSPISSVPYVLIFCYPLTLGDYTLISNLLFIIAEIAILRRRFAAPMLLQIPVTIIFSWLLDFSMPLAASLSVDNYALEILVLLTGCLLLAFGLTCEIVANVVMLAGDGIVNAIASNWKLNFGYTKIYFDSFLVLTAAIISYSYLDEIIGIREGTLISAFLVGYILRFFIKTLTYTDTDGALRFKIQAIPLYNRLKSQYFNF